MPVELEVDTVVHDPLSREPLPDADVAEKVGVPLLDHARADPLLAVLAAARLEDDRLDALDLEDAGEREPGRPRADDPDLRPHSSSASTLRNTWNARFAAGTPQ